MAAREVIMAVVALCYFAVSAIWSFLMGASLSTLVYQLLLEHSGSNFGAFSLFEILSAFGLVLVPVSMGVSFGADWMERKGLEKLAWKENWTLLIALGPTAYYAVLVGGGVIVGLLCALIPGISTELAPMSFLFGLVMSVGAVFLLILGAASTWQFCVFGKRLLSKLAVG